MWIFIIIFIVYSAITGIIEAILDRYGFDLLGKSIIAGLWPFILVFLPFLVIIVLFYFITDWILNKLWK